MGDMISREAAIDAVMDEFKRVPTTAIRAKARLESLPSAQPQRMRGRWTEKHHADEEKAIEEWQSCKCSVCGRYDTRPYLYYFNEPHFCSWCGADMRGGEQDE